MQKDRPAVAGRHLDSGFSIAHSLVILFDGISWTDPTSPWGEEGARFGKGERMGAGGETLVLSKNSRALLGVNSLQKRG
jgi:hypothetical protein